MNRKPNRNLVVSSCFNATLAVRQLSLTRLARSMPLPGNGMNSLVFRARDINSSSSILGRVARSEDLRAGSSHFPSPPYEWFNPTEPQATAALVQQVNSRNPAKQSARATALLKAALCSQPLSASCFDLRFELAVEGSLRVKAEETTSTRKRMDILVQGRADCGAIEVVIEAKFGHQITDGQLESYTKEKREAEPQNQVLLVVAPTLTAVDAQQIIRASKLLPREAPWRFIDWRTFLIAYSCSLQKEHDDEEFRRLRHTLHSQAERWI